MILRALLYLQFVSLGNAVRRRLARLRQPKYFAGAAVAAAYFYFFFFRHLLRHGGPASAAGPDPMGWIAAHPALVESGAALLLLAAVAWGWIYPQRRAALEFSEAEIAFLFPAPVTRRTLIHYKLLKSQLRILVSALLLTLLTGRFTEFGGGAWMRAAGWWLVFSTLNLHYLGASFARTRLFDLGVTTPRRRAAALALLGAAAIAVLVWLRRTLPAPAGLADGEALARYAEAVLGAGPLPVLLWPFRLAVRPFFAADGMAFLRALGPALLLLAAHYLWVVRSDVAFEEATLAAAQRRAKRTAARREGRRGGRTPVRARRAPFALAPAGPAPVAFLWKNLIAAGPLFRPRAWLAAAAAVVIGGAWLARSPLAPLAGGLALAASVWLLLAGPQFLRHDLRQDLPNADILKSYPVRGWQVVLGELLAPALSLAALQWLLLLLAAVTLGHAGRHAAFPPALKLLAGGCFAALAPFFYALLLTLPNAAVLFFPSWAQTMRPGAGRGLEVMGQRLIFFAGQFLVFAVALLPAAFVTGACAVPAWWLGGPWLALPAGTVVAAAALAGETAAIVHWLGAQFERFDLTAEETR